MPVVGLALGHRAEHVALARAQAVDGARRPAAAQHAADDLGVERAAARRDAGDRVDERVDVADALLEQVADALGAGRRSGPARSAPRSTARARARRSPGSRWRSSSAARSPSSVRSGGICTSTTATSGRCASALRSRSSASPACATTSKPASVRSRAMPSRSSTSSSPMTMRSGHRHRHTLPPQLAVNRRASGASGRSALARKPSAPLAVTSTGATASGSVEVSSTRGCHGRPISWWPARRRRRREARRRSAARPAAAARPLGSAFRGARLPHDHEPDRGQHPPRDAAERSVIVDDEDGQGHGLQHVTREEGQT